MKQLEYFPEREQPRPRSAARRFAGFRLERGINPPISDEVLNAVKNDPVFVLLLKCDAIKITTVPDAESSETVTNPAPAVTTPKTPKPTKPE